MESSKGYRMNIVMSQIMINNIYFHILKLNCKEYTPIMVCRELYMKNNYTKEKYHIVKDMDGKPAWGQSVMPRQFLNIYHELIVGRDDKIWFTIGYGDYGIVMTHIFTNQHWVYNGAIGDWEEIDKDGNIIG